MRRRLCGRKVSSQMRVRREGGTAAHIYSSRFSFLLIPTALGGGGEEGRKGEGWLPPFCIGLSGRKCRPFINEQKKQKEEGGRGNKYCYHVTHSEKKKKKHKHLQQQPSTTLFFLLHFFFFPSPVFFCLPSTSAFASWSE